MQIRAIAGSELPVGGYEVSCRLEAMTYTRMPDAVPLSYTVAANTSASSLAAPLCVPGLPYTAGSYSIGESEGPALQVRMATITHPSTHHPATNYLSTSPYLFLSTRSM